MRPTLSRARLWKFALLIVPVAVLGIAGTSSAQTTNDDGPVYVMHISGTIDLGLAPYVERVISEAEDDDAAAIIIEIDTPGGRLDAVIQMRDAIIDTDVRTIALVDSTAYSAGALVAIASDEIYMTPGAVLGAATPIEGGTGKVADEKTISAVRAAFAAAAEENGRDPRVAEAMVDSRVTIDGLVNDQQLLTLTVSQATEFGYSDGTVANLDALIFELGLENNDLEMRDVAFAEQLVRFLTNPLVAGLLLLGGFLLIVGDFFSGGLGFAAAAGVGLLAIFFWGHMLAGLAGWEDVVLMLIGMGLIAAEVFVIPGFGVAGILGLISLSGGAFLAMIYRDHDFVTNDDLTRAGLTVVLTLVALMVGIVLLIMLISRRGFKSGLVLSPQIGSGETLTQRTSSGWLRWFDGQIRLGPDRIERPPGTDSNPDWSLVGSVGVAVSDLCPGGIMDIGGHRVDVVTAGEYIDAGAEIEVIRDDRYRRVVRARL